MNFYNDDTNAVVLECPGQISIFDFRQFIKYGVNK